MAAATTDDAIFGGRLRLRQPRRGYRFSVDSVLLAAHAAPHAAGRDVLDVGTGVGTVGLALLHLRREDERGAPLSVTGIELHAEACALAAHNARVNGLAFRVVHGDARQPPFPPRAFGLIVANPPYRARGTGRLAPDAARAAGRHDLTLTATELMRSVADLLAPGGRACIACLPERESEIDAAALAAGLRSVASRAVRPAPSKPPVALLRDYTAEAERTDEDVVELLRDVTLHADDGNVPQSVDALLRRGVLPAW